jgi:predicted acylesterase/phospholipase RssA
MLSGPKLPFLHSHLRSAHGATALCLSGGAGNGYYHLGVARSLFTHGLLPKCISGSSAGALIGAGHA